MYNEDEARKESARVASSSVPVLAKPYWRWAARSKTDNNKKQGRFANQKTNRKKPDTLRASAPDGI